MSYVSEDVAARYNERFHSHGSSHAASYQRNVWRRVAEVSYQVGQWLGRQFLRWWNSNYGPRNLGQVRRVPMISNPSVGPYSWRSKGLQRFHWRAWRISTSLGLIIRQLTRNQINYLFRCITNDESFPYVTEKTLWRCLQKVQGRHNAQKPLRAGYGNNIRYRANYAYNDRYRNTYR